MTVTVTLKGVLLTVIALLVIVLLIYVIMLLRKLIGTLKQVDEILDDTQTMTTIAADRVQQVDGVVGDLGDSVAVMVDALKGNQSTVAAFTHVTDAVSALVGIMRGKKSDKDSEGEVKSTREAKKAQKSKKKKTN